MAMFGSRSSKKTPAAASASSTPARVNFKKIKRDKSSSAGAASSFSGVRASSNSSEPTTTRVQKAVHQSGDKEGEESDNMLFIFNPRKGLNDQAIEAVRGHRYGKDDVSKFNRELKGFHIRVVNPKQAQRMHDSLRAIDSALPQALDVGGFEAPVITIYTLDNLNLPATRDNEAHEGVTALMLDGYTYPLYKKLRALGYDFVRGVHNHEGVNKWVRVVVGKESAAALNRDVTKVLEDEGWRVDAESGDAAEWDSDDDEE